MIKNFDEIKAQLKELAEIINAFKSETVQVRIVELIFGLESEELEELRPPQGAKARKPSRRKKMAKQAKLATATPRVGGKLARSTGTGGKATLTRLIEENFFKTPKTIKEIVTHCKQNMALTLRQSDFSGSLARYVRAKELKRVKNADNQYEYSQA